MDCEMSAGFKEYAKDDGMPPAVESDLSQTDKEFKANSSVNDKGTEVASLSKEKQGTSLEADAQPKGTDDPVGTIAHTNPSVQKTKSVESTVSEDDKGENTTEAIDSVKIRNRSMLKQAQNLYFHSMYLLQDLLRPEMGITLSKHDIEGIEEIYDAITQRVSDLSHELDEDDDKN